MIQSSNYLISWQHALNQLLANIEENEESSPNTFVNTFATELEEFFPLVNQLDFECYNVNNDNYLELFIEIDKLLVSKAKSQDWKSFFVSNAFLDIQFEHNWIKSLLYFFHQKEILHNLPTTFLLQFAHSYGLILSRVEFVSIEFKNDLLLFIALQLPQNQRFFFYNLFSDKVRKSFITHNTYLGLLNIYYADVESETKSNHYKGWLSRIHYKVYPSIFIEREDETIILLAYFIKRFKDLDDKVLVMLTLNLEFDNVDTSSTKDLYTPLRDVIQEVGGNIEETRKLQNLKVEFLTSILPKALEQNTTNEEIDLFFLHSHFRSNVLDISLINEIAYQIRQSSMISYAFWERLYDYYSSILLSHSFSEEEGVPSYINSIKALCEYLTNTNFSAYMINYGEKVKNEHPELTDWMMDGAKIIAEEDWDTWLRHRIFFENLEIDSKIPMRTIFHTILLGLLESAVTKNGYTYDIERDGRYTISYKDENVVVIFSYDYSVEDTEELITTTEVATMPMALYTSVLKDVVTIYLAKYFNLPSVKKQFTDWMEQL